MRKIPLVGAAAAVVLGLTGVVSFAAASQASAPSPAKSQTLVFDVVFSPFEPVQANNVRNPNSPFALGDEIVAHEQLRGRPATAGRGPAPAWPAHPAPAAERASFTRP